MVCAWVVAGCGRTNTPASEDPVIELELGPIRAESREILASLIVSNPTTKTLVIPELKPQGLKGTLYCTGYIVTCAGDEGSYIDGREDRRSQASMTFQNLEPRQTISVTFNLANIKRWCPPGPDGKFPFLLDESGSYVVTAYMQVMKETVIRRRGRPWTGLASSKSVTLVVPEMSGGDGTDVAGMKAESEDARE